MRSVSTTSGLTLLEVIIAVVLLGIGVIATVGTTAAATRLIGQGRSATRAAQAASRRMEMLRAVAHGTTPECTALVDGADTAANGVFTAWRVVAAGKLRTITIVARYQVPGRTRADTLHTKLGCN